MTKDAGVTPETFEAWVRAIVADEFELRKGLLEAAVKEMLDRHDQELVDRLNRQGAVLARI